MRKQITDKERVFAKDIADKDYYLKIYKEALKLNNKKATTPQKIKKKKAATQLQSGQKIYTDPLTQADLHMTDKHMRRSLTPFVIRELQIQIIMDINIHLLGWQKAQALTISNVDKHWSNGNFYLLLVEMQIGPATLEDSFAQS